MNLSFIEILKVIFLGIVEGITAEDCSFWGDEFVEIEQIGRAHV